MKYSSFLFVVMASLVLFITSCDGSSTKPAEKCSAQFVHGVCPNSDEICNNGICIKAEKKCEPSCSDDQVCINGNCLQGTQEVDCQDKAPENATSSLAKVIIKWNQETKEWEEPAECLWECNTGFKKSEDEKSCIVDDTDPCSNIDCGDNATCNDGQCICNTGFEFDSEGTGHCIDIDECSNNNGGCSQKCENTEGSFTCSCNDGYKLNSDGKTCDDIDECTEGTANCDDNAICNNNPGSFECICKSGYEGDGETCSVIAVCENNPCTESNKTVCKDENHDGIAECLCDAGYRDNGNGVCLDVNECNETNNCSPNANCRNNRGGYECTCKTGYEGNGFTCSDIDECANDTNNCDSNATCSNNNGGFTCTCNSGYTGDGVTCSDIDECADNSLNNCNSNATCSNNDGGFTCACNSGYYGDGVTCSDINECEDDSLNNCDSNATCSNNDGGFTCACNSGYTGDGVTCSDIDECADNTDNCDSNATCSNNNGGFTCACNSGYTGDGVTCSDIDECANDTDNCDSNATCTNNDGGFTCACNSGYTGNGVTCSDIDECEDDSLNNCDSNATCTNNNGGFTCTCNSGYTGDGVTCSNIDDCASNPCIHGTCSDLVNDYSCTCETGYDGKDCDLCANGYQDNDNDGTCEANCNTANLNCNHGTCNDQLGEAICVCETGYAGENCSSCANNYHDVNGTCVENECNEGDTDIVSCGDGHGLQDVECVDYEWSNVGDCVCDNGYHLSGGTCIADSCNDGIKNQDEIGVDCGGSVCGSCCGNGVVDTGEECDSALASSWNPSCEVEFGEGYQGTITCDTCTENIDACYQSVVINEIMTGSGTGWVELYNKGTADVTISNWTLMSNNELITFTDPTTITANGYIVVNNLNIDAVDGIGIYDSADNTVDEVTWTTNKNLYGRYENGTGNFQDLYVATPASANVDLPVVNIDWCDVQSPKDYTVLEGATTTVYGQIYGTVNGQKYTGSGSESPQIKAKLCYMDNGIEICKNATYNTSCSSCGNNDEYMEDLTIATEGSYQYYYKFSGDMGNTWTKCTEAGGSEYTATIQDPNVVVNGDFELWTNGSTPDAWTTIDSGIEVNKETTIIHGGTASNAVTVNTGNQSDTDFRQTVSVTSGLSYNVSVWVYHPADTHLKARLFYDGTWGNYSNNTITDNWQVITGSFTPGSDSAEIGLRFYDQSGFSNGEIVYIDDFTVTP